MNHTELLRMGMLEALRSSMLVVRDYQRGNATSVEKKGDGTIVTPADKASEAGGKAALRLIHGIAIHGEETGKEGTGATLVYLDALDGSMPFALGAGTSSVIVAAVEMPSGKVTECLVGVPQSGQIWKASLGLGCETNFPMNWNQRRVYDGPMDRKSRVFIDSYPGFTRKGNVILDDEQLDDLHSMIQTKSGLMMLGSNGTHHALVANGGKGAVGAITTAIGGPWDVCPVLLVLEAGGAARAFARVGEGLVERNPLVVDSYDILVTGHSRQTVDELVGFINETF